MSNMKKKMHRLSDSSILSLSIIPEVDNENVVEEETREKIDDFLFEKNIALSPIRFDLIEESSLQSEV